MLLLETSFQEQYVLLAPFFADMHQTTVQHIDCYS